MPQVIAEELKSIPMSPNLGESLERAHRFAREQTHRAVMLEHLLLALTEDPEASLILQSADVDLVRLRADASTYLGRLMEDARGDGSLEPRPDPELLRVLQAAASAAQQSKRRQIDGAIVLAAIVGDGKSPAAGLLKTHGMTFEQAIRALQLANTKARLKPIPKAPKSAPAAAPEAAIAEPQPSPETVMAQSGWAEPAEQPAFQAGDEPLPEAQPKGKRQLPPVQSADDILAAARARIQRRASGRSQSADASNGADAEDVSDAMRDLLATNPPRPQVPPNVAPPKVLPPSVPPATAPQAGLNGSHAAPAARVPEPMRPRLVPPPEPAFENAAYDAAPDAASGPRPAPNPSVNGHAAPRGGAMARGQNPGGGQAGGLQPSLQASIQASIQAGIQAGIQAANGRGEPMPPWPGQAAPPMPASPAAAQALNVDPRRLTRAAAPLPSYPAPPAPQRKQGGSERGPLVESIPRRMRRHVTTAGEVRIARDRVDMLVNALAGRGGANVHEPVVMRALTVRLRAVSGDVFIEPVTPETQWLETHPHAVDAEPFTWSWHITPRQSGKQKLVLLVSMRSIGHGGASEDVGPPDRVIDLKVKGQPFRRILRGVLWLGLLGAAAALGHVGGELGPMLWRAVRQALGL